MAHKTESPKNKEDEQTVIELGKFYFLNGKYKEAVEEFQKVLKFNPRNDEAYYSLGLVYETQGKTDDARQMYEKALKINDKYELAREHLNKLIGL